MYLQTNNYHSTKVHYFFFFLLLISFLYGQPALADINWKTLKSGIEYIDLGNNTAKPWSHTHVFRLDLSKIKLTLNSAKTLSKKAAFISEFGNDLNALIAINGGFFDRQYRPLGLRISQQKKENPLKKISWWGIFYIKHNQPYIKNIYHFNDEHSIDFAIQSGPRLIVHNKIPSLKPGIAERTALGITKNKKIIMIITENNPITTTQLAQLMKSPPLLCVDALNLDGGSSTQMYAKINEFKLIVPSFAIISDAIIVHSK